MDDQARRDGRQSWQEYGGSGGRMEAAGVFPGQWSWRSKVVESASAAADEGGGGRWPRQANGRLGTVEQVEPRIRPGGGEPPRALPQRSVAGRSAILERLVE